MLIFLPWWPNGKKIHLQCRRPGFNPWVGKTPWRRAWQPTPVFLPGKSHGQRSWWATVHGVRKSQTRTSDKLFHFTPRSLWLSNPVARSRAALPFPSRTILTVVSGFLGSMSYLPTSWMSYFSLHVTQCLIQSFFIGIISQ